MSAILSQYLLGPFKDIGANPTFFIEVVVGGILAGLLYSLVALGFVLIFKASGVFNFAQGVMVLFAALTLVGLMERGVPVGIALFPKEINVPPRKWAEAQYQLVHWTEMPRGGHFAALEEPTLLAEDVRTFFGDRANFVSHGGNFDRGRLGVEFNKTFLAGEVRITPYGSINAVREFDGESTYTVADNFFGRTSVKGTSTMAEVGIGVQTGGWGFNLGANWTDGGAFDGIVGGQASIRFAW